MKPLNMILVIFPVSFCFILSNEIKFYIKFSKMKKVVDRIRGDFFWGENFCFIIPPGTGCSPPPLLMDRFTLLQANLLIVHDWYYREKSSLP